jgi:hydrogenase maturation protease
MNLERVNQIAKAVLYEGYMLYPYRPSSVKNRQRFNFGVLYPRSYCDTEGGSAASCMRTEFLVIGSARAQLEVKLRFLQLQLMSGGSSHARPPVDQWQEAVEREISVPKLPLETLMFGPAQQIFQFPLETITTETTTGDETPAGQVVRTQKEICGQITISIEPIRVELFRVRVDVVNSTVPDKSDCGRDEALLHSLASTHVVLGIEKGEFVSLLEPPEALQDLAKQCQNTGVWPVLVGDPGDRDTLLASPIILYDYPQIAPESPGDLFDGTEIDEILSLRIMTLTDEEKREIRESDERARQILERTDNMLAEQFMKLHGAVRGLRPVKESVP